MSARIDIDVPRKYLKFFGEPQSNLLDIKNFDRYRYTLVIPAFSEGQEFIENLLDFAMRQDEKNLIIVVINQPAECKEQDRNQNLKLIASLLELGRATRLEEKAFLINFSHSDFLILGPHQLPKEKGVGLARKIGADLALRLIVEKIVSFPLIYCTDADARLPKGYYSMAANAISNWDFISAIIYPFQHERPTNAKARVAIELYERKLYHYVDGLKSAFSPYAFHTIGSTMAVEAKSYAAVRGSPKVCAGEDFYLLNKLRKVGDIKSLTGSSIVLSARASDRVPFGTGPAMSRLIKEEDPLLAQLFYHPQVFLHLQWLLKEVRRKNFDPFELANNEAGNDLINQHNVVKALASCGNINKLRQGLLNRKNLADRAKAFHDWFDALRTLRFIHFLQANIYPMLTYNQVCDAITASKVTA